MIKFMMSVSEQMYADLEKTMTSLRLNSIQETVRWIISDYKKGTQEWEAKRSVEEAGYLRCPECSELNWAIDIREEDGIEYGRCSYCGIERRADQFEIVKREEVAYECPKCEMNVTDTPENWSWGVWAGPELVVMCPKCLIPLRGYIHHEDPNGPKISVDLKDAGGYQWVYHENCPKKDESAPEMELLRITVDPNPYDLRSKRGTSRIVLVFQCPECGEQQVIKFGFLDTRIWDSNNKIWWINPKFQEGV